MDLSRYGIAAEFPRLSKLAKETAGLAQRHAESQGRVAALQRELQQGRVAALTAEAEALKAGRKPPQPKSPDLERELVAAERDTEVLRRAHAMAAEDHATYIAEHKDELREAILDSLHGVALQLREHALAAGELFAALEGSRPDLRALRPPPPPEPEMPEGWTGNKLSNDYLNFGPNMPPQTHLDRGTIEGVLSHLASLTQQFEERRALVPASEGMGADSFAVGPEHGEAAKNFLTDAEGSMAADEAKETAEGVA